MPKQIDELPLAGIHLDYSSPVPMYKQLYNLHMEGILSGKFKGGLKLPGTRTISCELKISRNTVAQAFEQLSIEGYITGTIGAGIFITNDLPDKSLPVRNSSSTAKKKNFSYKVHKKFDPPELLLRNIMEDDIIPFQNGLPSLEDFPIKSWLKIINRNGNIIPRLQFGYKNAAGYQPLRKAVADYLQAYSAVNCTPEQIIIINGSQQGLDIIGRALIRAKDNVMLEDLGYFGTKASVLYSGANIFPVPVDEEGIDIDFAAKKISEA